MISTKSKEIDKIWEEIDKQDLHKCNSYQKMVCIDLISRVFIGSSGIPSKRFISIEIPENQRDKFDSITDTKGFTVSVLDPDIPHIGFVSCILQSSSHDQNDVFTVLAKDIVNELYKQTDPKKYITVLIDRILKWKEFFKNLSKKMLSDSNVIGLIGELNLIRDLMNADVKNAADLWNGPIKSAQDFQGQKIAVEVKTSSANQLKSVNISSEAQLDPDGFSSLYLAVYRIERNDASGERLSVLIKSIAEVLSEQQKSRFYANLLCLGYKPEDENLYSKGYSVKERIIYSVEDGFPSILRKDLPQGVMDVKYRLNLENCDEYKSNIDLVIDDIKELENG